MVQTTKKWYEPSVVQTTLGWFRPLLLVQTTKTWSIPSFSRLLSRSLLTSLCLSDLSLSLSLSSLSLSLGTIQEVSELDRYLYTAASVEFGRNEHRVGTGVSQFFVEPLE